MTSISNKSIYDQDLVRKAINFFEDNKYNKAVKTTREVIKRKQGNAEFLKWHTDSYITLMNIAAYKSSEHQDLGFHRTVLEEGLNSCRQAEENGHEIDPLCYSTFYQDLLRVLFFTEENDLMRQNYESLMLMCNRYLPKEPRLLKHKISGQLNYAVFCGKMGDYKQAEELACEAIGEIPEMNDDESREQTLFMISALNILSNIRWEEGDAQGALRDLGTETKILNDFLDEHPDMAPSFAPMFFDLILHQARLHYKIGEPEEGEALVTSIKSGFDITEDDMRDPWIGLYIVALKKIADFHCSMHEDAAARGEYQELLYILSEARHIDPKLERYFDTLEENVHSILISNNL